ncbi:MAG TPA: hypothetical protein PKW33_17235 [Anaerolineaceae bacterium]|nr:hypothetical protein [Anaerolineaceae bacterium]HPN53344.1 hypothetical protein [Anaerolineaceae bacterium]
MLEKIKSFTRGHLRWRWVRWQNDRRIEALAAQVKSASQPAPDVRPVVFFNASTRLSGLSLNAAYNLLTAWSLRLSGVPVVHFACRAGLEQCVLGLNREDLAAAPPCRACLAQSQAVYAHADVRWLEKGRDAALEAALRDLPLEALLAFTWQEVPLGELALPALRWTLRRHHLPDTDEVRGVARRFMLGAWQVTCAFNRLLDEVKPQAVVVFNGMFYPEAATRRAARQRGLPVFSHEVGLQPFSAYFTPGEATAYPIDIPADFELSAAQNQQLDAYLARRFKGDFSMAGIRFWPEMTGLSPEFEAKAAAFRQVVPVFTNVIFDTSQPHSNVVFPHMFAWLDEVLALAESRPDTLFVIRAHPDESRPGKESRESVGAWAAERQVSRRDNVVFVESNQPFSSYEMIQRAKFVMIYNSTIGLEAAIMGAAVLCAGKARFTQYPTVFFPATVDDFRQTAQDFLAAEKVSPRPEFARNARRFLYYQLYRTSLPFDAWLEEDGIWRGFVRLKPFGIKELLPGASKTMSVIADGILRGGTFLLDEEPCAKE